MIGPLGKKISHYRPLGHAAPKRLIFKFLQDRIERVSGANFFGEYSGVCVENLT